VRYTVDEALCAGHGLCFVTAPRVFEPDEDGLNRDAGRTVEVGDEHLAVVESAARVCPEQAIHVLAAEGAHAG
jgi:ferredoxin